MPRHLTRAELDEGLAAILRSPRDGGTLAGIVIRPASGERRELASCDVSLARGVHGDRWADGCWKTTADGLPHPDVQVCLMNARCIGLIAQERGNWSPAGDNLFVDLDLTPGNSPPGTRLAIGTAVIEITAVPQNGCDGFIRRYGRDACLFVNTGEGKRLRLRGIYGRVVQDGRVSVGDVVRKLPVGAPASSLSVFGSEPRHAVPCTVAAGRPAAAWNRVDLVLPTGAFAAACIQAGKVLGDSATALEGAPPR